MKNEILEELWKTKDEIAKEHGFVTPEDYVINLTSMPVKEKGMVNTMRVTQIS